MALNEKAETSAQQSGTKRTFVFVLTFARMPLAIVFAFIYLTCELTTTTVIIGLALLFLVELSDLLDGMLARQWGVTTEDGAMMDPYMDSVSRLVVFWALACAGITLAIVPLVMAIRDVTVAYCRITYARGRMTVKSKWSGKIKAAVQAGGAMLLAASPVYHTLTGDWPVLTVSWIVVVVTAFSSLEYVKAALAVRRS